MLKITKAADPIEVKQITLTAYAPPGVGKTSLGFTAAKPLLLDFDKGAYRSKFRKDTVQVADWSEVETITPDDLAPYSTVVVDTAGRALDALTVQIIRQNPKMGRGGALTLQGYGELKSKFTAWLKALHALGKDVVMLAHMDEQRNGDEVIERLDVQGGSKGEIYKSADAMARILLVNGQRTLNFNPTDTAYGKNPAQLDPIPLPDYTKEPDFLAGVIAKIKAELNAQSAAGMAEQTRLSEFRETFAKLDTAEDFDAKAIELKDADKAVKGLLVKVAKDKGWTMNAKSKKFEPTQSKAA